MASALINVALSSIRPPHASYYGDINDSNPVVNAANKEIKEVIAYFNKKAFGAVKSDEACSRGSNWLFDVWNKYEPRLPVDLFYTKLVEVGDCLRELGVHDVSSRQCYRRYLITRYGELPTMHSENAHSFRKVYFDDQQNMDDHILTSKAILGMYVCEYNCIYKRDPNLLASESAPQCLAILKGIRTFMQCLMAHEPLCWMVYNCTILIYQMCRVFMTSGNSIKIIEFLLWAAMCMETMIPLLGVRHLSWRVTLYSAVCLAYYDCKAGHHAEGFARRGLSKLQELSELERLSSSAPNAETPKIFRQATTKMASMVFKRSVFETRRKPKGYLRPKVRNNLKDSAQMTWPRTVTEKLLSDMFEGSAAQFLGILEALSSSHRRTLHNGPASSDADMLEVNTELFFAGKEIIAGGGGTKGFIASGADHSVLAGVQHQLSLMEMAAEGMDGVTISSVVRFIKLAFCYDNWSVFNTLLDCALIYIKKSGDESGKEGTAEHNGTELCLALLLVMERVAHNQSFKKIHPATSVSVMPFGGEEDPPQTQASGHSVLINDDLVNLAETVLYCINEPSLFAPQALDGDVLIDKDMILDASLLLWQRCKMMFGRLPCGARKDIANTLQRTGEPGKWLHILTVVHSALTWCGIGAVDPVLMVEVTLRLAVSLEAAASSENFGSRYSEDLGEGSRLSVYSTTQVSPSNQLAYALQVLNEGLQTISIGRSNMTSNDGQHVADISWMAKSEQTSDINVSASDAFVRDLHVEILVVQHRISLRLMESNTQKQSIHSQPNSVLKSLSRGNSSQTPVVLSKEKVKEKVGGTHLSRAIFLMEKADYLGSQDPKAEKLLGKAVTSIEHAQHEEKRLLEESWLRLRNPYNIDEESGVPSPPILLSRSDTFMTFKPSPFDPDSAKVAWYRLFGRLAAGPNVKVRLNDYYLPGTGDEVPAGDDCVLRVDGLSPNQRYVFAVAAYTSNGKLIGGAVGETSNPIVASHPLSIMAVWGHLAQISYKLGNLQVSKKACSVLWDRFVAAPSDPPMATWTSTARKDFSLTLYHLNQEVARESSPVLLRHALTSVFVAVETAVYDKEIFCDKMSEKGPLLESQTARLKECERMLVAMEIAGWLNDASSVLQAVVQTYGLICPIIQAEVTSLPVMQVATRCHSALQEVRNVLKMKRSNAATDSLNHMVAVLTNYISMFAKIRGKPQVALAAIDAGKILIRGEPPPISRKVSMEQASGSSKRTKSRKAGPHDLHPDRIAACNHELTALEERISDLNKEMKANDELLGTEEPNVVLARLSKMKPLVAFRELMKFRRRTRFLEFFVVVLRKALKFQNIEVAIEWSQDVLASLHRRNDALVVNRAVVSKQPGGIAVQGDEARKYAAAIAEYSHEPKKNRREEAIRSKKREKQRKFTLMKRKTGEHGNNEEQEEAERKAMFTLSVHLLRCYKDCMKRRKLRKIVADEIVWRSEFNLLNGLLHYQVFLEKIKDRHQLRGIRTPLSGTYEFLDQDWWSYEVSGAVVVGWDDGSRPSPEPKSESRGEHSDPFKRALDKAAYLAVSLSLVAESKSRSPLLEERSDSPKTLRTASTLSHIQDGEIMAPPHPDTFLHPLKVSLLCFRRAMVLAYRAGYWATLQNVASALYSSVMVAMQMASDGSEPALTVKELRELVRMPITMAADLLMDMLVRIQDGRPDGNWLYKSFMGEIKDEKGGHSLKFEDPLDDAGTVNILLIKRIVFHSIQILHFDERYEKLVDICLRFSELTHDRYCEVIGPLVVHAQAKIRDRVRNIGGEAHPQQHLVEAAQKLGRVKIEVRDYLRYEMKTSSKGDSSAIGVGGFIDPESHDVYEGGRRAFALSCVPFDPESSMNRLRIAFSQSQYMSRALQHARRLLVVYLASQHNNSNKPRQQSAKSESRSGSCVEFSSKADEPHPTAPPDITEFDFTSTDVVEVLASPQISTVLEAYNRTLELLMSHGEHDLVSQASNEIANLYFHQGNTKTAHKWWTYALDQIFKTKNSLHHWKSLIKDEDNIAGELLSIGGIWGTLLALSLTCKIGEFTASNTEMKSDCALLAVFLVRAIFRSSMPHPTADCDYATYEIVPTTVQLTTLAHIKSKNPSLPGNVHCNSLLNGIDLFSDRFRCDLHTLVASLHWLCEHLVGSKFCLQALPALTFYQYLATFVCRDTQRSVQCRCLKLSALTELRMFKEASDEALNLLYGMKLPHQTDVAYFPNDPLPINVLFDTKKSMEDIDNLKVLEVIASKRLSVSLSFLYGPHLTCEVTLCQANLLSQLAGCISCIPQKPTAQDLQFVSPDHFDRSHRKSSTPQPYQSAALRGRRRQSSVAGDDTRSTFSAFSTTSTATKNIHKLFTKRERPMGLQLLKGMLLAVAENLSSNMTKVFEASSDILTSSEVWLLVKCLCLLSEINQQRQLSTISASKAMSALKVLRDTELFKEDVKDKPRKLRSALRIKRMRDGADGSVTFETPVEPFPVFEQMYRTRLNSRLWLDCRLRLCQALATQVKGLGKVESGLSDKAGLLDHSQAQLYCAEGLAEAEACNDVEMQALFLIQGATLDGISSSESKHMLEDAVSSLDEQEELSNRAIIGLVESTTTMADICLAGGAASDSIQMYKSAHSILLLKIMQEGETIEHFQAGTELSNLNEHPMNLYTPNLQLLAQIKLRIAHTASQELALDRIGTEHGTVAKLLSQAQKLSSSSVIADTQLLAEIHLEYGKIQRLLFSAGIGYSKPILSCLQEAVNLSLHDVSDLSMARHAHLEMTMVDLVNIERKFSEHSLVSIDPDRSASSPSLHGTVSLHEAGGRSMSVDIGIVSQPLELTQGKSRVAQSLYAAYHAACGLQHRALLPGNAQVTTLVFSHEDKATLPDFVLLDLSSDHADLPAASSLDDLTQDYILGAVRANSTGLSWIHVLMYNVLLLRKSRLSASVSNEISEEEPTRTVSESEESVMQANTSCVWTPMKSRDIYLRMSALHMYLKRHAAYAATCASPPIPKNKSYVAAQWYRATTVQLLWALSRMDGTIDCGRVMVNAQNLDNISQQVVDLKKRTDEYFGRSENQQDTSQTQRRKTKPKIFSIDTQLEEDWKHVISQINNLISSQDDLLTQLPFEITLATSTSVVNLFTVGCCFDKSHALYKWMTSLLCPC